MKYLVVIEKGTRNYSAYSPDILGCVATGKTVEETLKNIQEALQFHLEGILENGEQVPIPKGLSYYLSQTDEISGDEILVHVNINIPELVLA